MINSLQEYRKKIYSKNKLKHAILKANQYVFGDKRQLNLSLLKNLIITKQ